MTVESKKFQELRSDLIYCITSLWRGFPPTRLWAINHLAKIKLSPRQRENFLPTPSRPCSPPASPFTPCPSRLLCCLIFLCTCPVPVSPLPGWTPCVWPLSLEAAGECCGRRKAMGGGFNWSLSTCISSPLSYLPPQTILRRAPHIFAASCQPQHSFYLLVQHTARSGTQLLNPSIAPSLSMAWTKLTQAHPFCYSF